MLQKEDNIMENKNNQNKKPYVNNFKRKVEIPGQFPTDSQGRITNNRCQGIDASEYSWEKLFKKTPEEKAKTATEIAKYNRMMATFYGENWRSLKGKDAVTNVPVKVNKQTMLFELI